MEVLELHFNPRTKKEASYESFCYEPENEQEKKLGNLYIVTELKNNFKNSYQILNSLASSIKEEYYSKNRESAEKKFKKAVKKGNEFLLDFENINLAIIALSPSEIPNEWEIYITKQDNINIILSREKETIDIGKDLKFQKITSGQLIKDDKIIVLTEEVYNYFQNNSLLEKFLEISNKNEINKILKAHKNSLKEISGIFLFIIIKPFVLKTKKIPNLKFNLPILKFKLSFLKTIPQRILGFLRNLFNNLKLKIKSLVFNKKILFILFFIIILIIGSLAFKKVEKEKQIEINQQSLEEIRQKVGQAESFLIFKDEIKANLLLQEAWKEISALNQEDFLLKDQAEELKKTIENKLYPLNKVEKIEEPEIVQDFDKNKFSEQITYKSNVYSLNSDEGEIIRNREVWGKSEKLVAAKSIAVDGSVWILDKENKILRFYTGKYQDTLNLDFFPAIENASKIFTSSTLSYIYILEPAEKRIIIINKKGEIIKQFISEKFDSLQNFYISPDGKTIYLLNPPNIYKINL